MSCAAIPVGGSTASRNQRADAGTVTGRMASWSEPERRPSARKGRVEGDGEFRGLYAAEFK